MGLHDDAASLQEGLDYRDVSGEAEKATEMQSKTSGSMDVNGNQILPSQPIVENLLESDDDDYGLFITCMTEQVGNKFFWVIKYPSLMLFKAEQCYSVPFEISGFKWQVAVDFDLVFFNLDLCVAECQPLPSEVVKVRLKIVNHLSKKLSISRDSEHCFDKKSRTWGFSIRSGILSEDSGFLVNGELIIVAEVIGVSDVVEESIPLRKLEQVNGFHVLPSQVQSLRFIFERQPDIAEEFCAKNQHLRTTYMHFLLGLIQTLYQPIQEISNEDLVEANNALTYLKDMGFKVDWLEKKLKQVEENKEKELSCEARVQEIEAQLHDLKHEIELVEAELSAIRAPPTIHHFL